MKRRVLVKKKTPSKDKSGGQNLLSHRSIAASVHPVTPLNSPIPFGPNLIGNSPTKPTTSEFSKRSVYPSFSFCSQPLLQDSASFSVPANTPVCSMFGATEARLGQGKEFAVENLLESSPSHSLNPQYVERLSDKRQELRLQELQLEEEEIRVRRKRLELTKKLLDGAETDGVRLAHSPHGYPAAEATGNSKPQCNSAVDVMCDALIRSFQNNSCLPKVEIEVFDGKPQVFHSFVRNFENLICDKVFDHSQRLSYLLHYCRGAARESIEHCVLLPKDKGFNEAMSILRSQFGQPHQIAKAFTRELFDGPVLGAGDIDGLRRLARQMKSCGVTLSQLGYTSDLNCSFNLERIVCRLPRSMQHKWAEIATDMMDSGKEPQFENLLMFIEKRVLIASSQYGMIANTSHQKDQHRQSRVAAIVTARTVVCPCCTQEGHDLTACSKFVSFTWNDKRSFLQRHKRCYVCLRPNHLSKDCRVSEGCTIAGCNGRHHALLHVATNNGSSSRVEGQCHSHTSGTSVQLGFVPVVLIGPKERIETYAFIDNGSDTTLIDKRISGQLGLQERPCTLNVRTVHGSKSMQSGEVTLKVSSLSEEVLVEVDKAFVVDTLPIMQVNSTLMSTRERYSHLADVPVTQLRDSRVGILIGCNVPEAHWVSEQRIGTRKQPYAVKTLLGWILRGPTLPDSSGLRNVNYVAGLTLDEQVRRMFELEFVEQDSSDDKALSVEDSRAVDIVRNTAVTSGGHYEIGLPWRSDGIALPNNRAVAERRLMLLRSRLLKDHNLKVKYFEIIQAHIDKGYVCNVDTSSEPLQRRWYLPHHPVLNANKPGKVRIVFDCAATFQGKSLNGALLQGPDLANNLPGVLLRFRKHPIALSADVEEMFLQVRVPKRDRWALSFLWWDNEELKGQPKVFEIAVHPFGATSSPFCANYALRKTALDNAHDFSDTTVTAVQENFYVDDCLISVETIDEARVVVNELRQLLLRGGFKLVKWLSNDKKAIEEVPERERVAIPSSVDLQGGDLQRALGVTWHVTEDCFKFKVALLNKPYTRRGILAQVASIYDPLGYLAPLVLPGKKLLQDLCCLGVGWDELIDEPYRKLWEAWLNDIRSVETVAVPRCLKPANTSISRVELHMFSDASEVGYGAVGYIRHVFEDESASCCFLMGKARVAPRKATTIPRLELVAAVLSAKLMKYLMKEMKLSFERVVLWTDSTIVLQYLKNKTSRFSVFVTNRVRLIQEYTNTCQWRHVPTCLNPADTASRGARNALSPEMKSWIEGPEFLKFAESTWPPALPIVTTIDELEVRQVLAVASSPSEDSWCSKLFSRYSSWIRLLKAVAWLTRFKSYLLMKRGRGNVSVQSGLLTVSEMNASCEAVIRLTQREFFDAESFTDRPRKKKIALAKLKPVLVNGILRIGGRIQTRLAPEAQPMILPHRCVITELIIRHYHEVEGHMGASHVLASIRKRFWIVKGMSSVRRVLSKCIKCRTLSAVPCQQLMAPLPVTRTNAGGCPFTNCGVDYFGPFEVREGRKTLKRYGCLFTCLQTRAIHIEIAHSLSTDSFLMALVRFIGRRGTPKIMYSDNGTNFVGAELELRRRLAALDQSKISGDLLIRGIEWRFNPPAASHRGGVWERLIRTVRRVLQAIVRTQVMTDEALLTCVIEVERIVNDRPIVPVYDDPSNPVALRPNDLLLLRANSGLINDEVSLHERYTKGWRQAQHLANMFWKRWTREYLPTLQACQKWSSSHRDLQPGDFVLLIGGSSPRGTWQKGIVDNVVYGPDKHVREVNVRTSNGCVRRDIRSLCLLEADLEC